MITVKLSGMNYAYGMLKPGTIFSWPVHQPKEDRAFALKIADGKMLWLHDACKHDTFCSDLAILCDDLDVEIEGMIIIS